MGTKTTRLGSLPVGCGVARFALEDIWAGVSGLFHTLNPIILPWKSESADQLLLPMKLLARATTFGTKPAFVALATALPFTNKVATPDGVTETLKYCQVLSWITFVAVTLWDEPPRKTVKDKSFDVPALVRRILSLTEPFPKSKYRPQVATDDVYAHTPALKPCEKSVRLLPGMLIELFALAMTCAAEVAGGGLKPIGLKETRFASLPT